LDTYTFFDFELWCKAKNFPPLYSFISSYGQELELVKFLSESFNPLEFGSYITYITDNNLDHTSESLNLYKKKIEKIVMELGNGNEEIRKKRSLQYFGVPYYDYLAMLLDMKNNIKMNENCSEDG